MAVQREQPQKRKGTAEVQQPISPALANFARLVRAAADAHREAEARIAEEAQKASREATH